MSTVPRDVRICGSGFFFKHKTAYEMRISDWSSDVCSSDLTLVAAALQRVRLRHDRALETVRGSFLQALFSVGDRPDLAAETNFTEGHGLVGQRLVAQRRQHRQQHRQVGRGFLHADRSEEHTSELQSLMRISYAVFCLKTNTTINSTHNLTQQ